MSEQNDDNNIEKTIRSGPVKTLSDIDRKVGQKQRIKKWILCKLICWAIYGASWIHMSEPDEHSYWCSWIIFEKIPQPEGIDADKYKIKRNNKGNINPGAAIK